MKLLKIAILWALLAALMVPNTIRAKPTESVVGDGTAASCTEAALAAALAAGGLITFNCGGDATIIFSSYKTIANTVVLDGGNRIILSANGSRHFDVPASGQLTLRNITVQNGFVNGDGGSIRNSGATVIEDSLLISNTATRGGAIFSGPASRLVMTRTLIGANQADYGAGIYGQQAGLKLNNSILKDNVALNSGGGIDNWGGEVHVEGSLITGNRAQKFAEGVGGGVNNWFVFVGNTPFIGMLVTTDTTLTQNYASKRGGALHNAGAATLQRVTLDHNSSNGNGGGIYNTINDSTHTLRIRNSTISNNSVGSEAGALYQEQGKLDMAYSTFASNNSDIGGAIVIGPGQTSNTQAKAVIFASSGCSGGALQSAGYNLETGNTCGLNQSTDRPNTNPQLGELADNGGPTQTRMPALNSLAKNAGDLSCDAVDQRGEAHPTGTACDIGAVEITPPPAPVCGGEFGAIKDATLSASAPNLAQGNATNLLLDNTGGKSDLALIGFDLSMLPPITEAHISKAVLQLSVALTQSLPVTNLLDVRAVGASWSESVVWNTQPVSRPSYANGGSLLAGGTQIEIDLTTLAMQWHSGAISQTSVLVLPGAPGTNVQVSSREGQAAPKLSIECAALPRGVPINPAQRTEQQERAITQLRTSSVVSPSVQFENGALVHATFEITGPGGVMTDALASWFLTTYNDLLGVSVPTDTWQLVRRSPDGQHIFFRQLHAGLPVFPTEIGIHLSNKKVMGFSGDYVPEITLSPTPILSATQAERIALNASAPSGEVLGKTQLRYIELALIDPAASPQTQLAWRVHTSASEGLYVDAYTGAVLLAGEFTAQDFDLDLETANGTGPSDTCWAFTYDDEQWFDENGPLRGKNPSQDGSTAFKNITDIYVWWWSNFRRDSYDNDGEDIQMYVHVDTPNEWKSGYPNAHYNSGCDIFEFASGMPKNDIMMHEFVHGIVHSEYNPVYAFQPGAINESLADTFAAFFDGNWTIGESVTVTASPLRSMSNPPSIPSPTSPAPYPPYPDRMSQIYTTFIGVDNGAVHFNSSILNKAAFLITAGQILTMPFNGHTVRGIGTPKAMRLYYNVMVNRLTKSSQFIDMARAMVAEAKSLRDIGFLNTADVCSVIEGFAAVELGPPDSDCNGVEDTAPSGGDFDKDGVPDTLPGPGGAPWDNCREEKNPFQENYDGDKLGDACDTDDDNDLVSDFDDNCDFVFNPDQRNHDKDERGDACDEDADGDDVRDTIDNCPFVANRKQEDADLDNVGDACDMDSDSDLICDFGGPRASGPGIRPWSGGCAKGRGSYLDERSPGLSFRAGDNCRLVPNQGQEDGDNDSVGDACDLCPRVQGVDNGDPDGDGQGNACDNDDDDDGVKDVNRDGLPLDNCREVKNPDQTDRDKNGKGFACDPEEQRAYLQTRNIKVQVQFDRNSIVPVPIDNCPSCGLGVLPSNLKTTVVVNVPVGVKARIVDSEGFVVAKSTGTGNAHVFTFSSKPFAGYSFRSGGFRSFRKQVPTLQTAEGAYSYLSDADVGYALQLVPGKDVDLSKSYEVTVGITTQVKRNKVFLPLARK